MTTLLMLPGLLLDRRLFEAQTSALQSEISIVIPELWHARDIGAAAPAVLDQAPERFALLGLSMGGYVAFEIMRRAPERVTRLALLDTQAGADDEAARATREQRVQKAKAGRFDDVLDELHPTWVHSSRHDDRVLRRTLREMATTVGIEGFAAEMQTILRRPDSRPDLPRVTCPTLVLCGREDQPTPLQAHLEMAEEIPDATLVVLPNCGHLAPLEKPAEVTEQLRIWLAR
ncbi:MAG: alpha/beta hydrolase [Geminicoccaceae bacterium]|nr:alpha/beta hydrolase [Geminicoccaceae bacterium]